MRFNLNKPKFLIILALIIFSSVTISIVSYQIFSSIEELNRSTQYTRINIIGDNGFLNYDFEGDGSPENPYINESNSIKLPENAPMGQYDIAITINYVSKCFIIRNNYIHLGNQGSGIYLDFISGNFSIENNVIIGIDQYSSRAALSLLHTESDDGVVSKNKIRNNGGFFMEDCNNVQIINNTFKSIYWPRINFCSNCSFSGNIVQDSAQYIEIYQCPNMIISDNTFTNTPLTYRYFLYKFRSLWVHSPNTTIVNNKFELSGLELGDGYSYLIENNFVNGKPIGYFNNQMALNLSDSTQYGQIFMINCNLSIVEDQIIQDTTVPLRMVNCLNCTVYNCTFSYNWFASIIRSSVNITFFQCIFEEGETGFSISNSILYFSNNIFKNLDDIITLYESTLYWKDNIIL